MTQNPLNNLRHSFFEYLTTSFSSTSELFNTITFELNTDENKKDFGDISTNAALIIAKALKKNPREIAQTISKDFVHAQIKKTEIAGPGFINFFLTQELFSTLAHLLFADHTSFFAATSSPKKRYCIEFVSANPTGPLHLGHGRGGIIGDVLGTILRFLGHDVTKEYYINDAGSQILKLGLSLKIRCQQQLGYEVTFPEDGYHGDYIKTVAQECIQEFGESIINEPEIIFAQYAQTKLLRLIQKTLEEYGIKFDVWFSEKTLHDAQAVKTILEHLEKGGFTFFQEGARWFASTRFGDDKDRVLQKATGEYTYIAADVAYLENKLKRGFDNLIMILGQDHHSYVIRMKALMQALGEDPSRLDIILYQLVTLKEDGELLRMSKRAGTMVTLQEVIETVGKDVARFFYLNRKADAHLEFDMGLALKKTEENPVYYIQYAYVRILSILKKSDDEAALQNISLQDLTDLDSDETALLKKIIALKTLLETISQHYQTHLLAYYTIELAHTFHRYYSKNRVIDLKNPEKSRMRLALMHTLRDTILLCLRLLGLSAPESM